MTWATDFVRAEWRRLGEQGEPPPDVLVAVADHLQEYELSRADRYARDSIRVVLRALHKSREHTGVAGTVAPTAPQPPSKVERRLVRREVRELDRRRHEAATAAMVRIQNANEAIRAFRQEYGLPVTLTTEIEPARTLEIERAWASLPALALEGLAALETAMARVTGWNRADCHRFILANEAPESPVVEIRFGDPIVITASPQASTASVEAVFRAARHVVLGRRPAPITEEELNRFEFAHARRTRDRARWTWPAICEAWNRTQPLRERYLDTKSTKGWKLFHRDVRRTEAKLLRPAVSEAFAKRESVLDAARERVRTEMEPAIAELKAQVADTLGYSPLVRLGLGIPSRERSSTPRTTASRSKR
jgi:hypothetical protein